MEKQGLELPTVDFVQKKVKDVEKYKNTSLKEEDVEKVNLNQYSPLSRGFFLTGISKRGGG